MSWWTGGRLIRTVSTVIIPVTAPHARDAQIIVADEVAVRAVVQTCFLVICQVKIVRAGTTVTPSGFEQTKAGTGGVCTRRGEERLTKRMNDLKHDSRETEVYPGCQDKMGWRLRALKGSLRNLRRQRQRVRGKTKGFTSRTMLLHVHYKSLNISLPSSAKQQREMTNSALSEERELRRLIF